MAVRVFLHRRARGISLVELLVVVAVVAALATLLLPAVQMARESARRITCLNNLRHMGCALHGHLLTRRTFPVGCTEWRSPSKPGPERCLAWSSRILPWLELGDVADRIDFGKPFDHVANAAIAATPLAVYICPSADRADARIGGLGRSDYGGVTGERITSPNNPEKGAVIHDRAVSARDVADGLSRTVLVGECAAGAWPDGQWINGRNLFDQAYAVNWPTWEDELRSRHPGGGQALFGDGAVRLLGESTDSRVLAAACTRAGRESLPVAGTTP